MYVINLDSSESFPGRPQMYSPREQWQIKVTTTYTVETKERWGYSEITENNLIWINRALV